jgi:methyltransferase-like protein/2-polyprenyl-3-methyl-5-hydroxy-6-metoxy-1,4-benzoquinol methylase
LSVNHPSHSADEAVERVRADYDAAPYESHAYPESAPGRIAAIAHLLGLDAPEVAGARVVEIGCAAGGNLIPFAAEHPAALAVGIDLSQVQVEQGRQLVEAMGLDNLKLVVGDIASLDLESLGQFDFVICHGVYSWVPEHVQQAILPAIRSLLAPEGVAYLSYNTYPGWKSKEIVRDAMMLFGAESSTPEQKVSDARGLIELLDDVAPDGGVLATALSDYKSFGGKAADYYLLHEELETFNLPCYFLELLQRAEEHGLAYLAEARPQVMFPGNYGDKVSEKLLKECGHSQVLLEQYLDFVVNRTFRQTLLVHSEQVPKIRYQMDRSRWNKVHFAAALPPAAGATRLDDTPQQYGLSGESALVVTDPVVKAALDSFNDRWPWTLTRQELADTVRARIVSAAVDSTELEKRIDDLLEYLIFRGQVDYRLAQVAPEAGASTVLPEPIRRMAQHTREAAEAATFNRWHETVFMNPLDRYLLPQLDGTRTRDALVETLLDVAREGLIWFQRDGKRVDDEATLRDVLAEHVDALPQRLAELKLS